jgi:hypothetical protein
VIRSVSHQDCVAQRLAHRLLPLTIVATALTVGACSGSANDQPDTAMAPLLSEAQLGSGWVASDPGEVALSPATVAPPCPFEGAIPDVEIVAADSIEFGDEQRQLGINHTVIELAGTSDSAQAVLDTWVSMDCSSSDADQRPITGLENDVFGVELDTIASDFTQAVLIRIDGSTMSFLVVSGASDVTIDVARELAPLI